MLDINIIWIIAYLTLGGVVGFIAGLFGVGGGGLMVPVLATFFLMQGVPVENVIHLALGTSMAAIIMTSFSSMRAHNKKQGVIWPIVKWILPGIVVGSFATTFLVARLDSLYLSIFFSAFMAYVSLQMFLDRKPAATRKLPSAPWIASVGGVIGSISVMVSIGGGSLTVPYLSWHNIDLKKAIGTSAAIGLPISVIGSIGFMINGMNVPIEQPLTFGFVNITAVICISLVSYITAPIGVRVAHKLPIKTLKKLFALLLIALSIKMLTSVL